MALLMAAVSSALPFPAAPNCRTSNNLEDGTGFPSAAMAGRPQAAAPGMNLMRSLLFTFLPPGSAKRLADLLCQADGGEGLFKKIDVGLQHTLLSDELIRVAGHIENRDLRPGAG